MTEEERLEAFRKGIKCPTDFYRDNKNSDNGNPHVTLSQVGIVATSGIILSLFNYIRDISEGIFKELEEIKRTTNDRS